MRIVVECAGSLAPWPKGWKTRTSRTGWSPYSPSDACEHRRRNGGEKSDSTGSRFDLAHADCEAIQNCACRSCPPSEPVSHMSGRSPPPAPSPCKGEGIRVSRRSSENLRHTPPDLTAQTARRCNATRTIQAARTGSHRRHLPRPSSGSPLNPEVQAEPSVLRRPPAPPREPGPSPPAPPPPPSSSPPRTAQSSPPSRRRP